MQVGGPAGVRLMAEEILFPFFGRFDFVCLVVCFHLLLAGFSSFILPLFSHYEQCPRKSESEMKFTKLISDGHLKPRKVWEQLCRVVFFRAYSKNRSFVSVYMLSLRTVFALEAEPPTSNSAGRTTTLDTLIVV